MYWLRRSVHALAFMFFMWAFSGSAYSEIGVLSPNTPDGQVVAHEIIAEIPNSRLVTPEDIVKDGSDILVTLGKVAFVNLPKSYDRPVIATFISESEYLDALKKTGRRNSTAVFTSVAPSKQILLAKEIFGNPRVGLIYDKFFQNKEVEGLRVFAKEKKIDLIARPLESFGVFKQVHRLLEEDRVSVLLMLEDVEIYKHALISDLITYLHRNSAALITYAPGLVNSGALAAAFYERPAIYDRIKKTVTVAASGKIPPPGYPDKVSVVVNSRYLRSVYDILSVDTSKLEEKINAQ